MAKRPLKVRGRSADAMDLGADEVLLQDAIGYRVHPVGAAWAQPPTRTEVVVELADSAGKADPERHALALHLGGGLVEYAAVPTSRAEAEDLAELGRDLASRGVSEILVELLDLPAVQEIAGQAGATGALGVIRWIEEKVVAEPGLYEAARIDDPEPAMAARAHVETDRPQLLFLHGTFSNPWSSFGRLRGTPAWGELADEYGSRMLSFHHRTVSESPLDNARDLVSALPSGVTLDLCTHSRGGLVGEVLVRASAPRTEGEWRASRELLERLAHDPPSHVPTVDPAMVDVWARIVEELRERRIRIRRVVRVACPAAGTALAGRRLGKLLSILTSALGLTPGVGGNVVYELAKAITLETIRRGTVGGELPGLGAMVMDGPFVRLLAAQPSPRNVETTHVRGRTVGSGFFGRAAMWAIDRFFEGANDLVVNSPSMVGGIPRGNAQEVCAFEGPDVHHFAYFGHEGASRAVADGLTGRVEAQERTREAARAARRPVRGPVLFLLPGIGGSFLDVDDERVWLHYLRLALGGFDRLGLGASDRVVPTALSPRHYGELVEALRERFDVREFPYDWRRSLAGEARRLAVPVRHALSQGREVHFLGHSMGGLLARTLLLDDGLRARLAARGARVLMLGTPNRGSVDAVDLVIGRSDTLRKLALLDLTHDPAELAAIVGRFAGVLELLPERFLSQGAWRESDRLPVPDPAALERAAATREKLARGLAAVAPLIRYVAGTAPETRVDVELDGGAPRYVSGPGDGRVPYATGLIDDENTWYCGARHGALPNHRPAFAAYQELLLGGTTDRLSRTPVPTRAARAAERPVPELEHEPRYLPGEGDLADALLGPASDAEVSLARELTVSVRHGSMHGSPFPVMVGWERGTPLGSALTRLDALLRGELHARHRLGVLPADLGDTYLLENGTAGVTPPSVLVVGLGAPGTLERTRLRAAVRRAVVELLLERRKGESAGPCGLATVALGTSAEGVSVADAVRAVVAGVVEANRDLTAVLADDTRVSELVFYEHYADTATVIGHAVRRLATDVPVTLGTDDVLRLEPRLRRVDGWRGARPFRDAGEGRTLTITVEPIGDRALRFLVGSDGSRTDVVQTELGDETIAALSAELRAGGTAHDRRRVDAFFGLHVPSVYRERVDSGRDIVLQVRGRAASLPWELMTVQRGRDGEPGEPAVARQGFVRRLGVPASIRQKPRSRVPRAVVIGDPPSDGPVDLPGAAAEAAAVVKLLERHRLPVSHAIGTSTRGALDDLADGAMILHIASHGILVDGRTQVLLEGQQTLTSDLVQNLREVPGIIFLNCCHAGVVHSDRTTDVLEDAPAFAAQIAQAFLRAGARAVVAAGWEVDDAAARTFAERFYEALLGGACLSDAARAARALTHAHHPEVNTWGAYQVWGDRGMRLHVDDDEARILDRVVARQELLDECVTLTGEARFLDTTSLPRLHERADALRLALEEVPPEWADEELWRKIGGTLLETGDLRGACRCFERAARRGRRGGLSIRLFEDAASSLARICTREGDEDRRVAARLTDALAAATGMETYRIDPRRLDPPPGGAAREVEGRRGASPSDGRAEGEEALGDEAVDAETSAVDAGGPQAAADDPLDGVPSPLDLCVHAMEALHALSPNVRSASFLVDAALHRAAGCAGDRFDAADEAERETRLAHLAALFDRLAERFPERFVITGGRASEVFALALHANWLLLGLLGRCHRPAAQKAEARYLTEPLRELRPFSEYDHAQALALAEASLVEALVLGIDDAKAAVVVEDYRRAQAGAATARHRMGVRSRVACIRALLPPRPDHTSADALCARLERELA
ncbi:MAG TPA: CHAT domain-containing protein [Sandaracinaceae bacterium LLY-WYZ-13_1]|nr:CHAT domain-containing protein [Sandaracinaceae bacterium LLY-WYZ-13_1]